MTLFEGYNDGIVTEEDTGGVSSSSIAVPSPAQPVTGNVGGTPASDTRGGIVHMVGVASF